MRWLLNGPGLAFLVMNPVAQQFFAGSRPFVLLSKHNPVNVPPSWQAVPIRSFTSYRALKNALDRNTLEPEIKGILYDNEVWEFTPDDEKREPAKYMQMAAQAVHAKGLLFITAPATNLTTVLAPNGPRSYDAYLKLNLPADSARYSDVYDIQAQGSEMNLERYSSFVQAAAQQARAANPKVIVLAGISTNPSGHPVTADQIVAAISATRKFVDGYWLNIPKPGPYCPKCNDFRPDIAIAVLQRLSTTATR